MAATSTEQLACMLHSLVARDGVVALGVFPADQIPAIDRTMHCCFILNTEPRGLPGEHWLAFFYNHYTDKLEYFDSYGMPLEAYADVHKSMHSSGFVELCTPANTVGSLQSDVSLVCGHYCVVFLYWRAKNVSAPPAYFCTSLATVHKTAMQRDMNVLKIVRDLLRRGNCCIDMLTRSHCSQSCTCGAAKGR
jgi:hypothetical protein